ncbi:MULTISPECIES: hypothetical protein [unclassified Pseudomonas]|jgi:hypothetical protein|uniref:hypothetical protein n=1 Tax=unclassified Pseudomonas TaxID=196821 RepID=UPI000EAABD40|nr:MULTISPECIES: hypothetical protein [unclassified Pseudomonas]AYF86432.1 hypothetical protein D6Z43_04360 [Pseudomonas sp. DY-1]MRK23763.1 hypothetical protein [Pseudomonas sp. JG-B]
MKRTIALAIPVLLLAGALASTALAEDDLLRFRGGIGVLPVSSGQGTENIATVVNRNLVRGVQPAGQIWVIRTFEARVSITGAFRAEGRGLILGGGNNIGRATGQSVFATLFCGGVAPFIESSTDLVGVPLTEDGDFVINDVFDPVPPNPCDSPVLLIRNAANSSWFAAGIPRVRNNLPDDMNDDLPIPLTP